MLNLSRVLVRDLAVISFFALAACVASFRVTVNLGDTTLAWDPASHGLKGVAVAHDLKTFDVPHLYQSVIAQKHYPPVHSLLQAPFYLIFGYEPWAGVIPSLIAFFLTVLLMAFIVHAISTGAGSPAFAQKSAVMERRAMDGPSEAVTKIVGVGGFPVLLCTFFAATSVQTLWFANVLMLEIFAGVFLCLCVYGRLRMFRSGEFDAAQEAEYRSWTMFTGVMTTLLMLTSSNFGLLWLVTLFFYEFVVLRADQRRALFQTVRGYVLSRRIFHPLNIFVFLLFLLVLEVHFFGGYKVDVFGILWSVTTTGPPLYFVIVTVMLRLFYHVWKERARLREQVALKYRVFFFTVVLPLFLWFFVVYPSRFKMFFDWLEGASAELPFFSEEFLLFYPRAILSEFHVTAAVGYIVLALFVLSLILYRRHDRGIRFIQMTSLIILFSCFMHHSRDARFLVPLMPLVWCLAAHQASEFLSWIPRLGGMAVFRLGMFGLLVVLCSSQIGAVYREKLPEYLKQFYRGGELSQIKRYIVEQISSHRRINIMGSFYGLSHHIFEWEMYRLGRPYEVLLEFDVDNPSGEFDPRLAMVKPVFDRWLEKHPYDVIVVILRDDSSPYYDQVGSNVRRAWYAEYLRLMGQQTKYRLIESKKFEPSRVVVRIYGK